MNQDLPWDFQRARHEVSRQSMGGAPFLLAYGISFLVTAAISTRVPLETAALVTIFQGGLALPLALWLERRLGRGPMSPDNPLRQLSLLLAVSQTAMLPVLIVVCNVKPILVPLLMASFGAMHFVPYAWLHRTALYWIQAIVLVSGSFGLLLYWQAQAFTLTLVLMGIVYLGFAPVLWRSANRHLEADAVAIG